MKVEFTEKKGIGDLPVCKFTDSLFTIRFYSFTNFFTASFPFEEIFRK